MSIYVSKSVSSASFLIDCFITILAVRICIHSQMCTVFLLLSNFRAMVSQISLGTSKSKRQTRLITKVAWIAHRILSYSGSILQTDCDKCPFTSVSPSLLRLVTVFVVQESRATTDYPTVTGFSKIGLQDSKEQMKMYRIVILGVAIGSLAPFQVP